MLYQYWSLSHSGFAPATRFEDATCEHIRDRLMTDFPGPWWIEGQLEFRRAAPVPRIPSPVCVYLVYNKVDGVFNLLERSDALPTPDDAVENLRQKILNANFYENPALFPVPPYFDA